MSNSALSFGLDLLVLMFTAVTIYYAMKLSRSLNNFRRFRKDFDNLIKDLNKHIEAAEWAVKELKEVTGRSGADLKKVLNDSRKLVDELQIMNESGNNVAARLERLVEKSRSALPGQERFGDQARRPIMGDAGNSFSIQDRDYEEFEESDDLEWEGEALTEELLSQAEKELYQALQKSKKKPSGGKSL